MEFKRFYPEQTYANKKTYRELLEGVAQASRMFSDNLKPFIHYRAIENIFCRSFEAANVSREDCSVDSVKESSGIGIKTFLSNGATKREKIAEFNDSAKYPLEYGDNLKLIKQVAEYRNTRIADTIKNKSLSNCIYHYIIRDTSKLHICECPMTPIDMDHIQLEKSPTGSSHIIKFKDGLSEYQFHLTKHTLYKAFNTTEPYETIPIGMEINESLLINAVRELSVEYKTESSFTDYEYVILPLYSTRNGEVPAGSGLNQWHARGRSRHPDEIYIPIPRIVHKKKKGFFPPRDEKFALTTTDGQTFSAKVCQDNSKALMTDPNKDLGQWLLRNVLSVPSGHVVTYDDLKDKNADTVIIHKIAKGRYQIALHSFGAFRNKYKT